MPRGRPAAGGVNKSDAIRKYYEQHPDAKTKDCIDALAENDIEVSQALVAGVRSRMQGNPGNKRRKKGEITLAEMKLIKNFIGKSHLEASVATKTLMELAALIDEIGSIERFKEALNEFDNFEDGEEIEDSEAEAEAVAVGAEDDEDGDYEDVNDEDDD